MPMGSSICMVSVQVHAIRLDRAIMMPGSYSRIAMEAYSSHQPSGTEAWRKTSRPSLVDRQSDVCRGMRAAPRTLSGRNFDANACKTLSTSTGLFARAIRSVNSVKCGVVGSGTNEASEAMSCVLEAVLGQHTIDWPARYRVKSWRLPAARNCPRLSNLGVWPLQRRGPPALQHRQRLCAGVVAASCDPALLARAPAQTAAKSARQERRC